MSLAYKEADGIIPRTPNTLELDETKNIYPLTLYCSVGGVSAAVSKTAAAPIERVKLLIQNQVSAIFVKFIWLSG